MMNQTLIISAFCGTGKTYICENSNKKNFIEFECWKYNKDYFPDNYIRDIYSKIGQVDAIFISTNQIGLDALKKLGLKIILIYPELELKNEYMERYRIRGSSDDFIQTFSKYWDGWGKEIRENKNCIHIVLKRGQYISDVLQKTWEI